MRARRLGLVAVATLTLGTLVACGASEEVTDSTAATTDGGTVYPLTLDNCGETVTVDAPPSRVVSLDQDSTEILLSLGLQDRMVGTASWTDPVRANLADANAAVPRLADNAPTYEVVLDTEPDFVTASFGRHYKQGGVAEDGKKFAVVRDGVSLQQLVDGLNGLGIGPRDLISILQAIKAAGAIQADIEVM